MRRFDFNFIFIIINSGGWNRIRVINGGVWWAVNGVKGVVGPIIMVVFINEGAFIDNTFI